MNTILYSSGDLSLSYSSVILALAAAACFCMTWSFYRARGGRGIVLCLFLPLSVVLSVFLSRILHWYCHTEQYSSFLSALTDFRTGGFVLTGVLFSILLSAMFLSVFRFRGEIPVLLDCLAPGTVILFIFIRLSSLFNSSCRSKIAVTVPSLQRLPFAAEILDAAGNTEYRFATFFAEAIVLCILLVALLVFYAKQTSIYGKDSRKSHGDTWLMFLNWYSAIEVLADSTRYDSSFTRLNGFVSVVQTVCGVFMLAVLVVASVRAIRAEGLRPRHVLIWFLWLLSLCGAGISEYLVQRHGDWYLSCYAFMAFWLIMMAGLATRMLRLHYSRKEESAAPVP